MLPTHSQKLLPSIVGYNVDVSLEPEKEDLAILDNQAKVGMGNFSLF